MAPDSLNVIALISGGKDSFFNQLHCLHHGHRIVALANLYPATEGDDDDAGVQVIDPARSIPSERGVERAAADPAEETDLNSFMYQTVGHEVVPLYAQATGIPLYRQAIRGGAVHHERDYAHDGLGDEREEETESMIPLLRAIMERHPEANALCSGAILSTYQRTRVESVALRLGLTPLAYLWKYTLLPGPKGDGQGERDGQGEGQLLLDMEAAGLEARIIKVASAGLDERHLWERVSSGEAVRRVRSALGRFGAAEGAVLGEGGEFETLVVDGPGRMFRRRICVPEGGRRVVREGGGSNWLMLRGARLEEKRQQQQSGTEERAVRVPGLLDPLFERVLDGLRTAPTPLQEADENDDEGQGGPAASSIVERGLKVSGEERGEESMETILRWSVTASSKDRESIEAETRSVVADIRARLAAATLDAGQITTTLIVLRRMADFPKVNAEYGKLFAAPNPPSRVTISCGDLLPAGRNIMVYVTAAGGERGARREGLHVQSRSYWAPANIGPYSQAIDVGVRAPGGEATGVRSVYVAGQIPLVPASMVLPDEGGEDGDELQGEGKTMQIALSLQHLWRIGAEMKIQLWTSAVAYFARSSSEGEMRRDAELAIRAWRLAHLQKSKRRRDGDDDGDEEEENEDEDEDGPDVWDRRYNPQYRSLAGDGQRRKDQRRLPDWSALLTQRGLRRRGGGDVPPVFAAEVEELPRQSGVEWHAHVGLSGIGEGDAEIIAHADGSLGGDLAGWKAWHVVVRSERAAVVYTTLARQVSEAEEAAATAAAAGDVKGQMATVYAASVRRLGLSMEEKSTTSSKAPYLVYVDASRGEGMEVWMGEKGDGGAGAMQCAVVPCRSIWGASGRVGAVGLFQLVLERG